MRMSRCRIPTLLIPVILLTGFHIFSVPCAAEYLLDTARQFNFGDGMEVLEISTDDVNNDGIADMVGLVSWYQETEDAVVVRLGTGNGEFAEPVATGLGSRSGYSRMHVTRLDDDSYPDVVLDGTEPDFDVHQLRSLIGDGDGTFSQGATYTSSHEFLSTEPGDFTGDGTTDIAATEGNSVRLYIGQGDGTFSLGAATALGHEVHVVAGGDFDEDGDLDLVNTHYIGPYHMDLSILLNNGSGGFTPGTGHSLSDDHYSEDLLVDDVNGDGHLDVLAPTWDLPFFAGNGDGTVDEETFLLPGEAPADWCLFDIDEDGDLDLVGGWGIYVYRNDGSGAFGEPEDGNVYGAQIVVQDMDGDGYPDAMLLPSYVDEQVAIVPGAGDGTFRGPQRVETHEDHPAYPCAVEDMNGDGLADLVVGYYTGGGPELIQVFINEFPGGFSEPLSFEPDVSPYRFVSGDMSGDGISDLLIIDYEGDSVSIMLNAGDGALLSPENYGVGDEPVAAALGDLDGDGDTDIAVAHQSTDNLGILFNNGDGTFGVPQYFTTTNWTSDVALGDLDSDGDLDVVVHEPEGYGGNMLVLKNNGNGSFSAPQRYDASDPYGVALDDHDHDGDLDIATGSFSGGYCSILLNNGDGTFGTAETYGSNQEYLMRFSSADITMDGHTDLLALSYSTNDLMVLPGEGDGSFGAPLLWTTGRTLFDMAVADMDGDQAPEAIVTGGSRVYIINNNAADLSSSGLLVTGPGPGEFNPTLVRYFPGDGGRSYTEWSAYGVDRWGVNVALAELDGTPEPEVLTGAGPGPVFGPHVRGFQHDGTPLPGVSFFAYGTLKYGVNVCAGDLDNDGFDEIVTGAGPGAVFGPHVRGWNWDGSGVPAPIPGISYFAYGTPKWGVNVSCGDIDGDGYDEIVTGAGPGAVYGPHVRGWNCDGGGASSIPGVSFFAYGTLKFGVNVACGDIDGDGIDEMVTGAGPGAVFGPHVRAFNWDGTGSAQSIPAVSFFAYSYTQWGANVSCGDLDDDGIDEIITGAGPGESHLPRVRGWNYDGQTLTALDGVDFYAYGSTEVSHGVKVGGLRN